MLLFEYFRMGLCCSKENQQSTKCSNAALLDESYTCSAQNPTLRSSSAKHEVKKIISYLWSHRSHCAKQNFQAFDSKTSVGVSPNSNSIAHESTIDIEETVYVYPTHNHNSLQTTMTANRMIRSCKNCLQR